MFLILFITDFRGSEDDVELGPALELLSVHAEELKLESVLEMLPSHWSFSIAHHYLRAALRSSLHQVSDYFL